MADRLTGWLTVFDRQRSSDFSVPFYLVEGLLPTCSKWRRDLEIALFRKIAAMYKGGCLGLRSAQFEKLFDLQPWMAATLEQLVIV